MLKTLVPRWLRQLRNVRYRGGHWPLSVPDRLVLEDEILGYFAGQGDVRRVLDVGTAWFTRFYHRLLPEAEYWTIERYPELAKYGAPKHKAISLLEVGEHFEPASFDLVVCNGVFGWGLDDPDEIASALKIVASSLRGGGVLVVGWDDNDNNRPSGLAASASAAGLSSWKFPPRGESEIRTATKWNHVFSFYQKHAP